MADKYVYNFGGDEAEGQEDIVKDPKVRKLIQNFAIEMAVYAVLVVGYFFLVLRLLADPLFELFNNNSIVYAIAALVLIVAQGVLLEVITSFIMGLLGLDQLE